MSITPDSFIAGPKDHSNPDRERGAFDFVHKWMFRGKTGQEAEQWEADDLKHAGASIVGWRVFDFYQEISK